MLCSATILMLCAATLLPISPPAFSQCCGGARNVVGESIDGRFRVQGDTLTRVGHHGPYHYKFRFLEKSNDGEYRELNAFEVKWNVDDHFNMKIMVSPTGNGFAVEFPHSCLTFYRRNGDRLFQLDSADTLNPKIKELSQTENWLREYPKKVRHYEFDRDGCNVQILKTIWFGNGGMHSQDSTLFLPLGVEATDLLDAQVIWFLQGSHQMLANDHELLKQAFITVAEKTNEPTKEEVFDFLKFGCSALPRLRDRNQSELK